MADTRHAATPPPPAAGGPRAGRGRRRAAWLVGVLLAGALVLLLGVGGAAYGLLRSAAGTAWLLAQVPGVQVRGLQGAPLGDELRAEQVVWSGPPGKVEIDALRLSGLQWVLRPARDAWLGLHVAELHAGRIAWRSAAAAKPAAAPSLPSTLQLPLQANARVRIDTLQIDDLAPVQDLALTLRLATPQAPTHAVEGLSLRWDRLTAAGELQIAAAAPFAVNGRLRLASLDGAAQPWQADLKAAGTLDRLAIDAALQGATAPSRKPSSLSLKASVTPFHAWPLGALTAHTEALDLATLAAGLPQTRLSGQAEVHSLALDQPMQVRVQLRNEIPGRWDVQRLPLRHIDLALAATAAEPGRVAIDRFDLQFADAAGDAGRWHGSGRWDGHRLDLKTQIDGLTPQRLDARAAAMTVSGPLALAVTNLPSPDPAAAAPPAAPALALTATLAGRLDAALQAVRVELQARVQADTIQLERLHASAGQASAEVKASARRHGKVWALETDGRLLDFDPLPWWPGAQDSPWRRGPHRLSADWSLALTTPPDVETLAPLEALLRLDGRGLLVVQRSLLAGLPVTARIDAGQDGGTDARSRVSAELDIAGNRVRLDGRARPAGDGSDDRWQVDVDAPQLAALAPLARLHADARAWAPRQGKVAGQARLSGRWPQAQIEGRADIAGLHAGDLRLDRAQVQWQAASGAEAPLALQVDLSGGQWQSRRLPWARADLSGSWAAHRLRVSTVLPVQPAPALAQALGLEAKPGTRIELRTDGRWQRSPVGSPGPQGSRWSGTIEQLAIDGWDGRSMVPLDDPSAAWLDAKNLRATLDLGTDGGLRRAQVAAGRVGLAGGIVLRWDDVVYEPLVPRPALNLRAEIETFSLAPLLARWQPAMGWDGDLRVGAQIDLRAGERFDADIVVQRQGGDLRVRDATDAALALGLTDLRLALSAHDGEWLFTQALAGRTLGEVGGLVRVRNEASARWPGADAPLDGAIELRVADLGIWGTWVPPGWRLGGSLSAGGSFAGRFGAPQFTGALRGSDLAVRNVLLGVNVDGGQIAVRLDGERAIVEQFTLRGGQGTLDIRGDADLGATPTARLTLQADRFRVLGRIDRRLLASGRADLRLDRDALALSGAFKVDEGLFDIRRADAPTLDADVNVRRPGAAASAATAPARKASTRSVQVALDIDLGDQLAIRGRGLGTRLAGQLRVTAPGGRLAVHGNVRTVEGSYRAYGQNLEIRRGIVAFAGPADNPRLDILALRPKLDVEVGVSITGNAQSPRVRLHSNPEMSDTDKLSWLVLGRAPEGLGRDESALLQRAAVALLSGEEEGVTDGFIRQLGLDELSVRQEDGDVRDTVVTLGKQLSDRWYVGYERGVNATTGTWQLIYRVAQRFTLRAQSGLEESVDLIWVWRVP